MGLFSFLRQRLARPKITHLPVDFSVDLDDQGRHVVAAFYQIGGERQQIPDLRALVGYGYRLEKDSVHYVPSIDTINIVAALRSMNPTFSEDGTVVTDVLPSMLTYFRTKAPLKETPRSQELIIETAPLKPRAQISFDPATGLQVDAGYCLEAGSGLVQEKELSKTPDGEYLRFGNRFFPVEQSQAPETEEWLKQGTTFVPLDRNPEFFKRDLVLLKSAFNAVLGEAALRIRIIDSLPSPRVRVDVREPGWLDFQVEYQVGAKVLPLSLLTNAKHESLHLGDGTFVRLQPGFTENMERQLKNVGALESATGYRAPVTCFATIEEFIQHIGGTKVVTAAYERFLSELQGIRDDQTFQFPEHIESHLRSVGIQVRPYQRSGIHWMDWLFKNRLHGILADDMGLGKTLQTILAIRLGYERAAEGERQLHSLVMCPLSVIRHWAREIDRFYPEARVREFHGPQRSAQEFMAPRATIFIASYATLARDAEAIRKIPLLFLVLDEATQIKNAEAQRTEAAKSLNAVHRICLSGTPVENRPLELWSMFDFLMRGHLGARSHFEREFEQPILAGDRGKASSLARRVAPFILRRLKTAVAKDLPEKLQMTEWCDLTDEQRRLYVGLQTAYTGVVEQLRRGERIDFTTGILPLLTKLKQVCDHPAVVTGEMRPLRGRSNKFDLVLEKIKDILEGAEQVVIFSHFLRTLDILQLALADLGVSMIRIDGSTDDRQGLVDRFNEGKALVALCSLQAAGYGLNLSGANHVIHFDRWWNPAVEDQATDRVHRIGQERTVYVHRILVQDTIEEKIDLLLERKRGIADLIVGGDLLTSKQLTREELLEILKPLT